MPIGVVPVFGRILAERRKGEAVLDLETAKLKGLEELGDLGTAIEHAQCSSSRGLLLRCKVRDLDGLVSYGDVKGSIAYTRGSLVS